jgi:hypothetical protein
VHEYGSGGLTLGVAGWGEGEERAGRTSNVEGQKSKVEGRKSKVESRRSKVESRRLGVGGRGGGKKVRRKWAPSPWPSPIKGEGIGGAKVLNLEGGSGILFRNGSGGGGRSWGEV